MVLNQICPNICLFCNILSIASFVAWVIYRCFKSALSKTSINTNRTIHRGEMMQKETIIKLIKKSIQNFEETNDVEHLNDIIQMIFEYKKSQQLVLADS